MTQSTKPRIPGQRVVLRDTQEGDVNERLALGNSADIQAMFGADPTQVRPLTQEAAAGWVRAQSQDANAWVIEAEGRLIGAIRIHSINHADNRANIAVGILDPNSLGRGYGTEAMKLLAGHAFEKMGLHRLSCRVLAFNERAIAAYKKVGFVEEGRERESARIGQVWQDDVIMGLLASDLKA